MNNNSDFHPSVLHIRCLYALVKKLLLLNDTNYVGQFSLFDYKSAGFMYLDMAAVKALELFSVAYDEGYIFVSFFSTLQGIFIDTKT